MKFRYIFLVCILFLLGFSLVIRDSATKREQVSIWVISLLAIVATICIMHRKKIFMRLFTFCFGEISPLTKIPRPETPKVAPPPQRITPGVFVRDLSGNGNDGVVRDIRAEERGFYAGNSSASFYAGASSAAGYNPAFNAMFLPVNAPPPVLVSVPPIPFRENSNEPELGKRKLVI